MTDNDPFKSSGLGPRKVYARFEKIEDGVLYANNIFREEEQIILKDILHEKSPQIKHFAGEAKKGSADLSVEQGAILRFDKYKENQTCNYVSIVTKNTNGVMLDVTATVQATKIEKSSADAPEGPVLAVQFAYVDKSRTVEDLESFKTVLENILEDTTYTADASKRHVMLRRLDGENLETRVAFTKHDDEAPVETIMAEYEDALKTSFASGAKLELTPVLSLLCSQFDEKIIKPENLVPDDKDKAVYARLRICICPVEKNGEVAYYQVVYAQPAYNLTDEKNQAYRLKGLTQHWSPIYRELKDRQDEEKA